MIIQQLKAPNNNNGNPRRLWMEWANDGNLLSVYEEGYTGKPGHIGQVTDLGSIEITAKTYNAIKADAKKRGIFIDS